MPSLGTEITEDRMNRGEALNAAMHLADIKATRNEKEVDSKGVVEDAERFREFLGGNGNGSGLRAV